MSLVDWLENGLVANQGHDEQRLVRSHVFAGCVNELGHGLVGIQFHVNSKHDGVFNVATQFFFHRIHE